MGRSKKYKCHVGQRRSIEEMISAVTGIPPPPPPPPPPRGASYHHHQKTKTTNTTTTSWSSSSCSSCCCSTQKNPHHQGHGHPPSSRSHTQQQQNPTTTPLGQPLSYEEAEELLSNNEELFHNRRLIRDRYRDTAVIYLTEVEDLVKKDDPGIVQLFTFMCNLTDSDWDEPPPGQWKSWIRQPSKEGATTTTAKPGPMIYTCLHDDLEQECVCRCCPEPCHGAKMGLLGPYRYGGCKTWKRKPHEVFLACFLRRSTAMVN
jgi:hypothetical protein